MGSRVQKLPRVRGGSYTPALLGGGASKWDMKEALLSRAEVAGTPSAKGRAD